MTVGTRDLSDERALHWEVERFLYRDAQLLDEMRYEEWLGLFTPDGVNLIPPLDDPAGDPLDSPFLLDDTMPRIQSRVRQLAGGVTVAENPPGKSSRVIGNVQASEEECGEIRARASFILTHTRRGDVRMISGRVSHRLIRHEHSFLFIERRTILTLDVSVGHFSFIL